MKALLRNKQTFYYANISTVSSSYDEYGNETGEPTITYATPVETSANISPARGSADFDPFGINENYTKTIVTDDLTLAIGKSTILWIGIAPDKNGEAGAIKHNYVVVQVAKSLNSLTIAVKEVNVS